MTTEVLGLPRGRALTHADLDRLPEDGHRYELLDGILVVSPAPKIIHQSTVLNLAVLLRSAVSYQLKTLVAPVDVVLADDTVIQPDVLVAPRADFTERNLPGPPLVAVEILSPSTRGIDLLLKKERLARAGCPHYWVVDPDIPSATAWVLRDGVYAEAASATGEDTFEVDEPFLVRFTPASLIS